MEISEAIKMATIPGYAVGKLIISAFGDEKDKKSITELKETAMRQNLQQAMLESRAKTLQEIAIAKRIENATTVEIEEYYDISGNADAGLGVDAKSVKIGLSGIGKKVSKRVYRFTGGTEQFDEKALEGMLGD